MTEKQGMDAPAISGCMLHLAVSVVGSWSFPWVGITNVKDMPALFFVHSLRLAEAINSK